MASSSRAFDRPVQPMKQASSRVMSLSKSTASRRSPPASLRVKCTRTGMERIFCSWSGRRAMRAIEPFIPTRTNQRASCTKMRPSWIETAASLLALSGLSRLGRCPCRPRQTCGTGFCRRARELYLSEARPGEELPYERLLDDVMAGDGALFTRENSVEAAWAVVDRVLKTHHRVRSRKRRGRGPSGEEQRRIRSRTTKRFRIMTPLWIG